MAEINYNLSTTSGGDALVTWLAVTESDTFETYDLKEAVSEISVHINGTFGGSTVTVQGGNDGSTFLALTQLIGATASTEVADIFSILDRPLKIKPLAASGSSQSINVYMLVRK